MAISEKFKSTSLQSFHAWKIEWAFRIRCCVNFKFRNLAFSGMKNDAYLNALGGQPFKIRQDVRWFLEVPKPHVYDAVTGEVGQPTRDARQMAGCLTTY